ncbi:hypothetical protein D3229_06735 [Leucobacter aridicollis]|nr:hypothetical protein [Leucobacter aridicollis]
MREMAVAQAKRSAVSAIFRAVFTPIRWAAYLLTGAVTVLADSPRYEKATGHRPRTSAQEARQVVGAALWAFLPSIAAHFGALLIVIATLAFVAVTVIGRRLRYLDQATQTRLTVPAFWQIPALLIPTLLAFAVALLPVIPATRSLLADLVPLMWWMPAAAIAVGGVLYWVALLISARHAGFKRAKRGEIADLLKEALGVDDREAERIQHRGDTFTIRPTPATASARLSANPTQVDRTIAAINSGYEVVIADGSLIVQPVTLATQSRRHLDALSGGLVIDETSGENSSTVLTLAPGTSPSAAEAVAAYAATQHDGASLVEWLPLESRAVIAKLADDLRTVRERIAAQLKAYPHDLRIEQTTDMLGHRMLEFSAPQLLAADRVSRRKIAAELKASVAPREKDLSWRTTVDDTSGSIAMRERRDPLMTMLTLDDFREKHPLDTDPATSWKSFEIAITEDGAAVPFSLFHTLTVGQTGSGKGSVIWSILSGVLPSARQGLAEIYAIDPKGAEAIADDGSLRGMFQQVATTPDDWAALVSDVVDKMNARKGQGRSLPVTREQPLIVLFIDELSALTALDTDSKRANEVMSNLLLLSSQGRSMNVLIVSAVQAPQKDMVGKLRPFLPMRIALRTETPLETDLVLGTGATDFGAEAHLIPVASPGNGYRSAGIGYVRVEGFPEPQRVRFPYTDDATLDRWDREFRELRAAGQLPPQVGAENPEIVPAFGQILNQDTADTDLGEFDLGDLDLGDAAFTTASPGELPPVPAARAAETIGATPAQAAAQRAPLVITSNPAKPNFDDLFG